VIRKGKKDKWKGGKGRSHKGRKEGRSTTIDVGEQEQSGWFIGDEELTRRQQA
jgi:hypothetical protein